MNFEHVAFNVRDPQSLAGWLEANLDLEIVSAAGPPQHGQFLADTAGRTMIEIYHNAAAPFLDAMRLDPAALHVAFAVEDVAAARSRLVGAGATAVGEVTGNAAGDQFAIVRAPGGLPLQLVRRAKPLLPPPAAAS